MLRAPAAVKIGKRLRHDLRRIRILQQRLAMPFIQPAIHAHRESLVALTLNFDGPRLRMHSHPLFSLGLVIAQQKQRQRIREAEGHKVGFAILLPMRQPRMRL